MVFTTPSRTTTCHLFPSLLPPPIWLRSGSFASNSVSIDVYDQVYDQANHQTHDLVLSNLWTACVQQSLNKPENLGWTEVWVLTGPFRICNWFSSVSCWWKTSPHHDAATPVLHCRTLISVTGGWRILLPTLTLTCSTQVCLWSEWRGPWSSWCLFPGVMHWTAVRWIWAKYESSEGKSRGKIWSILFRFLITKFKSN